MRDTTNAGQVLLIDDDAVILKAYGRILRAAGFAVEQISDGRQVAATLSGKTFDVVVSDLTMPQMSGLEVLQEVRRCDPDLPVVLMTGAGDLHSATLAIEHGALRYLLKPIAPAELGAAVEQAVKRRLLARVEREAVDLYAAAARRRVDDAELAPRFERALASFEMAYQPIVCWPERRVHAHEALLRSHEPSLRLPTDVLAAAERLGRLPELGRAIRASVAGTIAATPGAPCVYVNLHPSDLADDDLLSPDAPLSRVAGQVVLEVTECAALGCVDELRPRLAALRALGFRVAIDDLGAGYSSLSSFAQLAPDVVKLDMALVRGVELEPTKRKLIDSMVSLCRELGILVIAEGVETGAELAALRAVGCDLFQGYLFARPAPAFPSVTWPDPDGVG